MIAHCLFGRHSSRREENPDRVIVLVCQFTRLIDAQANFYEHTNSNLHFTFIFSIVGRNNLKEAARSSPNPRDLSMFEWRTGDPRIVLHQPIEAR